MTSTLRKIRELLDSLERFSIEDLMKEIMGAPLPLIDYQLITGKAHNSSKQIYVHGTKKRDQSVADSLNSDVAQILL